MKMPFNIGLIHFIGIGGIGMSGIAELLHNLGYKVQGSDLAENANTKRLREKGIKVFAGHKAENIAGADAAVISSAVKAENVEYQAARARHLPIVRRAEMLAELMRFRQAVAVGGTHGKTTTTSLVSALLEAGGLDPTVINGGIINARGTNAYLGQGEWMVVEADESDGSFLKLPADIAVVTNIDPEHLDYYGSYEKLCEAFRQFVENVPFYGFGVLCFDHSQVQKLANLITDRRIVTYGADDRADVRFVNVRREGAKSVFDICIRPRRGAAAAEIKDITMPMPGLHNVSNAAAAIAVAHELGVSAENIKRGLRSFGGVKRRFTHTGSWRGAEFFDDYGHHPAEIRAALRAAREVAGRHKVIAVAQPHRYSRLHNLFAEFVTCFNDADYVGIAPVYAAGEQPIEGADSARLAEEMRRAGHRNVRALSGEAAVAPFIREAAQKGDCVVFLGAGNITQWAQSMPEQLNAAEGFAKAESAKGENRRSGQAPRVNKKG